MKYETIVGYSPIIIDINFQSPKDYDGYQSLLKSIGITSGEWVEFSERNKFESLIIQITDKSFHDLFIENHFNIGSTVIASFAAFNTCLTLEDRLVLVGGKNLSNDVLSKYFEKLRPRFENFNIVQGTGYLDICFVLCNSFFSERTMLMFKSINLDPALDFKALKNSLAFISAFEIRNNFFKFDFATLVSNRVHFAINLGDVKVLTASVNSTIQNLIQQNIAKYIFGNMVEFRKAFSAFQDDDHEFFEKLKQLSRSHDVIFFVTLGSSGIRVINQGNLFLSSSDRKLKIVNTNGAGDAAAGGFLSTYLATSDIPYSLNFAISQAEKVLESSDGILLPN